MNPQKKSFDKNSFVSMFNFFTIYFKYFDIHIAFINIFFNFKDTIRSKRLFYQFSLE